MIWLVDKKSYLIFHPSTPRLLKKRDRPLVPFSQEWYRLKRPYQGSITVAGWKVIFIFSLVPQVKKHCLGTITLFLFITFTITHYLPPPPPSYIIPHLLPLHPSSHRVTFPHSPLTCLLSTYHHISSPCPVSSLSTCHHTCFPLPTFWSISLPPNTTYKYVLSSLSTYYLLTSLSPPHHFTSHILLHHLLTFYHLLSSLTALSYQQSHLPAS